MSKRGRSTSRAANGSGRRESSARERRRRRRGAASTGASLVVLGIAALVAGGEAQDLPPRCTSLGRPDRGGHFVASADLARPDGRDGDDLLVPVDRSPGGVLAPTYAPNDLVDITDLRPRRPHECTPPAVQCLRREAAIAYRALENAMQEAGLRPYASSAFRSYAVQCATFVRWTRRERAGFCGAVTASALPGHSQHQLGTTLDLFTRDWMEGGDKFRPGYGCTAGGRWLAAHAHEFGFALPYPLHPAYRRGDSACDAVRGGEERIDPRTGYRYEPWHLRFVGVANAARFHLAAVASGVDTLDELTLDQWLRREAGAAHTVRAPVCDGCNCARCATFAAVGQGPCGTPALRLSRDGTPLMALAPAALTGVELARDDDGALWVRAQVSVPPNTLTQPPVMVAERGAAFRVAASPALTLGTARHPAYPDIAGAFRLALGVGEGRDVPLRAALAHPAADDTPNGMNARFPAPPGDLEMSLRVEGVEPGAAVRVALARGDEVRDLRELTAP